MIYVYCPRPSQGAKDLVEAIKREGEESVRKRRLLFPVPGSTIVNWGAGRIPDGVWKGYAPRGQVLNAAPRHNKLRELQILEAGGVPVPDHMSAHAARELYRRGDQGWLGRSMHHQEGRDLLNPMAHPDYYVRRYPFIREFRLHVVNGQVVRTGKKMPSNDGPAHPWIRSTAAGWRLDYGAAWRKELTNQHRFYAKEAVKALGYDFGAVDLAVIDSPMRPRPFVILEVNSAPGLSIEHTAAAYARHFVALHRNRRG